MKKIVVADYDKTFKTTEESLMKNLKINERFLNQGNIFVIATGRNYLSMCNEISKYEINTNYFSCLNANLIFDNKYNLLFFKEINKYIDVLINDNLKIFDDIKMCDPFSENTVLNPIEYKVLFKNREVRKVFLQQLPDIFTYYSEPNNKLLVHIFNNYDKTNVCKFILDLEKISVDSIFTIGDGNNDLNMIKEYNGFCITNSSLNINDNTIATYNQYYDFIDDLLLDSVKRRNLVL